MVKVAFSQITASTFTILPDFAYLMEENALRFVTGAIVEVSKWNNTRPFDPKADWNSKRILLIRNGGFGDLIMLTPLLGEFKRRWNDVDVVVCCGKLYGEVLVGNPDVSSIVEYPVRAADVDAYDAIVEFEETDVYRRLAHSMNMIDLYGAVAGLRISNPRPKVVIAPEEITRADYAMPRTVGVKRIGIQASASNRIRTYPAPLLARVIMYLLELGYEVILFGEIDAEISPNGRFHIVPIDKSSTGFMRRAAILHTCDFCIAPDSAYSHLAGALGIPSVVCYGPIPSQLRSVHYTSVVAIDGVAPCAPCFHHTREGSEYPEGGPCQFTNRCESMAQISPEKIVQAVQVVLARTGESDNA